ncbi:hypothetical protein [Thalassobacillus hwangdonensis]|uniref:DUF2157 domain-containing protein n=1 Tax=Thalassobacillus hwangdonensis TaxID=546108 RepID=A0ABW3L211_9BACI
MKEREKVFRSELWKLWQKGFISERDYESFSEKYDAYIKHMNEEQLQASMETAEVKVEEEKPAPIPKNPVPAPKPKKVKTQEQVRERNITWSLILGVVLLLISGLVVATTNWDQMGAGLKVISISFISIFFLGLSVISSKFLKIEKTAFAFLTLGSLLIPVVVLAIGYFELLGSYLSIFGEGRELLGLIGTLLPLPLYVRNGHRHQSRLFIWISYLFLSFSVGFGIAALEVSVDVFYLGIMIFNGLLLYGYHRFNQNERWKLFMKELPIFAQLNLIVSTMLMLFLFKSEVFYSFNVLLTAVIYMAMVFVYDRKEYQFVFSALFAYGAYQLTEHSFLQQVDLVVYAIIGTAFLGFAVASGKHDYIRRMFRYISAVISFAAFLYITYQGILLRTETDQSLLLLIAYLVIALNYTYLAYVTNHLLFAYLSPFFLFVSGFEVWSLIESRYTDWVNPEVFLFFFAVGVFFLLGLANRHKYLQAIRTSSYYLSIGVMALTVLYALSIFAYLETALMLAVVALLAIVVGKKRTAETKIAGWVHPVSLGFSLFLIYPELADASFFYEHNLNVPFHLSLTGLLILGTSLLWRKMNVQPFEEAAFFTGQGFYLFGLLAMANVFIDINHDFVRPLLLLIGIGISVWLVLRTKLHGLWMYVTTVVFFFYGSLVIPLPLNTLNGVLLYYGFAPIAFLLVDHYAGRWREDLKPYFFWFGQGVQLLLIPVFLLSYASPDPVHPFIFLLALVIYVYSALIKQKEWQVRSLMYVGMSVIPLFLALLLDYYQWLENMPDAYIWMIASGIFACILVTVPRLWKKRVLDYTIPFSIFGLWMVVTEWTLISVWEIIPMTVYAAFTLYLLHKRGWSYLAILPLAATIAMWEQVDVRLSDMTLLVVETISFLVLLVLGRYLFKAFARWDKNEHYIDWYTITAFLYVLQVGETIGSDPVVWLEIIPFVMVSIGLFYQFGRFDQTFVQPVLATLAMVSILPTYYLIFNEYQSEIPELIHAELIALPLMALVVLLSLKTWSNYKKVMQYVQLTVLLLVTIYLVVDAIQSQTIWDAVIIGGLSLVSILAGMQFRIKSYFFVGTGVLIFNVMYQTKPYWGNLPWWSYLLIAGSTLIAVASYNEWQKQKGDSNKGKLEAKFKRLILSFKEWD